MIRSKLGLKALLLAGLVLGLMAFGTAGAQAEPGSKWLVNGIAIPGPTDLLPHLEITELENKTGVLEFTTAGGTLVEILCTEVKFDTGGLLIAEGGISLFTLLFHNCEIFLNKVLSKNCKPKSSGQPSGLILTLTLEGLLKLDKIASGELTDLVKVTPENEKKELSKVFAHLELGELCSIGELVLIETTELGEGLWLKDCLGNSGALTASVTHLLVEADVPLHKLLALGRPALLLGSLRVGLAGEHKGLLWKGDWN